MQKKRIYGLYKAFYIGNYILLIVITFVCLFPLLNILSKSLSSSYNVSAGLVLLWPKGLTFQSYRFIMGVDLFTGSAINSLKRVIIGIPIYLVITIITSYSLSRSNKQFRFRTFFAWFFFMTTILNGGIIPWFIIIKETGIRNTIWALILPGAVNAGNIILLLNFFRQLPKEIEESASIDGVSVVGYLVRMIIPLSKAGISTITLFVFIYHWNSWFDGMVLMNDVRMVPLQTYLRAVLSLNTQDLTPDQMALFDEISNMTIKSAQMFISLIPIIILYPFLQKYFVKGIVIGSVKG